MESDNGRVRSRRFLVIMTLGVGLGMVLAGCATAPSNDPYAKTKQGALIGAGVGAVAGLFVGDGELDEVLGGAAVGAGVGAGIGVYMDRQQREIEQIEGVEVERVDEDTLNVSFDSDILFDVNSSTLSWASRDELDQFAGVMNRYPKTAILVQGHTDATGSDSYNQRLSERRADSVVDHLFTGGVAADRMAAMGYGERQPVADNGTDRGRAQNRRVNILVRGKS